MDRTNYIIGLCGVSCGGKTTVLAKLREGLGEGVSVISFDDYYIETSKMVDQGVSLESPDHYQYDHFVRDLKKMRTEGAGVTLVEGFLIFQDEEARSCYDAKIFIDLPEDVIRQRRISRKRGSESDTLEYINNELIPGQREYVYPQKKFADIILDGRKSVTELAEVIMKRIKLWRNQT
jgi:uridine kinase